MKRALLYLLIFSYTMIMFKLALPYLSDFISHTFWYAKHIATVHYENGKYHVHHEVIEDSKKMIGIKPLFH